MRRLGTTLVAAEMTGRRGFGIELDPKYADVILRRVSEETGVEPTLGGVPLSEVARMRAEAADEVSHEDAGRRQDGRPFAEGNVRDDGSYLVGKAPTRINPYGLRP